MNSEKQPGGPAPAIDPSSFKNILGSTSVSKEFFLPLERASWEGEKYTIGRGRAIIPDVAGVRLHEPDPDKKASFREKACQSDLTGLVRSIVELRKTPLLNGLVLSDEILVGRQPGQPRDKRAIFGLRNPTDGRFKGDVESARECHQQIVRAAKQAGFVVEDPTNFDANTGLKGLSDWANKVRLRRRRLSPLWLLLLLPLLLLLFFLLPGKRPAASPPQQTAAVPLPKMFGMEVTESFIILVDKSASMEKYFPNVRAEAKRFLNESLDKQDQSAGKAEYYAEVIVYDGDAYTAGGSLRKLSPRVVDDLNGYLDKMKSGGGTNLNRAVELAAQEAARHGKKTTLLILTDGADNTIAPMVQDRDRIRRMFAPAEVIVNTTTPRLFDLSASKSPADEMERGLEAFSRAYNGRFGPN